MIFNSHAFLFFFLPLTWIVYRLVGHQRLPRVTMGVLVLASLFFYGYWNPTYLGLIIFSILFNYFWGNFILKNAGTKPWILIIGLSVNLGLIGFFKYTNFLVGTAAFVFGFDWEIAQIVLPLGISFFTFQQIAYLVDCHRGQVERQGILAYALFVSFFPQLIAGPIVHHKEMMMQFRSKAFLLFDAKSLNLGITIFILGLFKKVIIADTLSPWVAAVFDSTIEPGIGEAWIGSLAYTFQIYFDFSGYSDMAIGLGHMFNVKIPINFNSPYKATSIIDFWRRWHMTLSRFLRDYLYIPLGGNKKGLTRRYINIMITMLLGGLWHGAAWTFVLWGGLHGLLLCINHGWNTLSKRTAIVLPTWMAWTLTFGSVNAAWVFFRAPSFDKAIVILKSMAGLGAADSKWLTFLDFNFDKAMWDFQIDKRILLLVLLMIMSLIFNNVTQWGKRLSQEGSLAFSVGIGATFIVAVLSMTRVSEFLYFQF